MSREQQTLRSFRQRIASLYFMKYLVQLSAVWLFLWGTVALALRAAEVLGTGQLLWGAVGFVLPPIFAALLTRWSIPSNGVLAAILDRENRAGGIFLAALELNGHGDPSADTASSSPSTAPWLATLPPLNVPALHWNGLRSFLGLGLGMLFLTVALLVPVETLTAATGNRLNVEDRVNRLTRQLDTLAEENILELEEVEEYKHDIDRIQKDAEGVSPAKTHEALDMLSDRLEQRAQEAMEEAEKKAETLAKAESLLDALEEATQRGHSEETRDLMEGLVDAIEKMMRENEGLRDELLEQLKKNAGKEGEQGKKGENGEQKNALAEALQKMLQENKFGEMTPEQMQQLAEAMKNCEGGCERMLESLKEGGFNIDPDMLDKLDEARKIGQTELQQLLDELKAGAAGEDECGDCEGCKTLSRCEKQDVWDRSAKETETSPYLESETDESGAKFKPLTLPPPELEAFREAQKIGVMKSTPEANETGHGSDHGGGIREIRSGTGTAHGRTVYPQHRGITGRYFERE